MRLMAGLLVMTAVAGCLAGDEGPEAVPPVAGGEPGLWQAQLCDFGYRVVQHAEAPMWAPADRECDFRVTKPLVDATVFDWIDQHGPGNEVSMAVNPTDPLNLIGGAKDYTVSYISDVHGCGAFTVWNGHFASLDGGRTWSNDLIPGFPGDDRPSPLAGNLCNTDPVSVFDGDGTYWHNGLNYRGQRDDAIDIASPLGESGLLTGSQIFFARSTDKGASFDMISTASYGDNDPLIFNDKNWLAVDPDSDHMIHTWTNFYPTGGIIEYVESFDRGVTWTHPLPLTPGVGPGGTVTPTGQFSMPVYDSNGDIWVIWNSNGLVMTMAPRPLPLQPSIFLPTQRLIPLGPSDGNGCLAATEFRHPPYPVLAIDTSGGAYDGRRYVTWPGSPDGDGDIMVASFDGDLASLTHTRTTQLEGPDDQFMPWVDVGPDGTVHVAYYDCSVDVGGRTMTVSWRWSDDGGQTWNGPFHVGQAAFDGDLGLHQSGVPFIGDYIAVDASDKAVHFFWADTRHTGIEGEGRPEGSDVYAATVIKDWADHALFAPELAH